MNQKLVCYQINFLVIAEIFVSGISDNSNFLKEFYFSLTLKQKFNFLPRLHL